MYWILILGEIVCILNIYHMAEKYGHKKTALLAQKHLFGYQFHRIGEEKYCWTLLSQLVRKMRACEKQSFSASSPSDISQERHLQFTAKNSILMMLSMDFVILHEICTISKNCIAKRNQTFSNCHQTPREGCAKPQNVLHSHFCKSYIEIEILAMVLPQLSQTMAESADLHVNSYIWTTHACMHYWGSLQQGFSVTILRKQH